MEGGAVAVNNRPPSIDDYAPMGAAYEAPLVSGQFLALLYPSIARERARAKEVRAHLTRYEQLADTLGVSRETAEKVLQWAQEPLIDVRPTLTDIANAESMLHAVAQLASSAHRKTTTEEQLRLKRLSGRATRYLAESSPAGVLPCNCTRR